MKTITKGLLAASLFGGIFTAVPADAATTIYTDQGSFAAAHPNSTFNAFPFGNTVDRSNSYSQNGVTIAAETIIQLQDGGYNNASYLDLLDSSTTTITSNQYSAYGFNLGSYGGSQTISYLANGVAGTLAINGEPGTSFIGFDLGSSNSLNAVFNFSGELDIVSGFQTVAATAPTGASPGAVPEPASWAMMILGMGAVGYAMRRQKAVSRVQFA